MDIIFVELSQAEKKLAVDIAKARNAEQRRASQKDGNVISSLKADFQGAYGELAVSKAFELPWDGKFFGHAKWQDWRETGHDVSKLEVRATIHKTGRLILHPSDDDNAPFVLVVLNQELKRCEIIGWIWGKDGKNQDWWEDVGYGRPCYYVPRNKLRPISELKSLIKAEAMGANPILSL